jgi:hypothetical protein
MAGFIERGEPPAHNALNTKPAHGSKHFNAITFNMFDVLKRRPGALRNCLRYP